ncbi:MAG TPA: DUF4332 domain-containing protein, partial [Candidatus Methylomirabilis sp.]|nr:DUF4332 domain-containing protein [Candidatus Methylomirabilis sp.]
IRVLFYCIAWWSYIVLVDALTWRRRGSSLLRNRPWEFLVLAFWSVAIWNLFELLNFRLKNWFYVNVPTDFLSGAVFTFFAYATVVPGLFETYDLLRAYRIGEHVRTRPWRLRPSGLFLVQTAGLMMLICPMVWPRHAYPLVWGFAVLLLDPMCYRTGESRARSLLAELERGDPRPALRLLLAGLICGGLWEFWNFWAYTKWMYSVPFFEDLKWFEMPPLGFLGFPPFTLECYVLVNCLNVFRRGRGWEESGQMGRGARPGLAAAGVLAALVFNTLTYVGIDHFTVQSYQPSLEQIDGVSRDLLERLARAGVDTPPALLRRVSAPEGLRQLARQTGVAEDELRALHAAARLVDLNGLGSSHYNALRQLGITRVEELASQDPDTLAPRWQAISGEKSPTMSQVKTWIRAARTHSAG